MGAILITIIIVTLVCLFVPTLEYIAKKNLEREREKQFAKSIENSFTHVKKYCSKFGASNDQIKLILSVFEELVNNGGLKYLQPYEAYMLPTSHYQFPSNFYIVVSGDLQYGLVITNEKLRIRDKFNEDIDAEESAKVVKKYLPYAKTLDEFKAFVNECQEEYDKIVRERKRRDHVDRIINKKIK